MTGSETMQCGVPKQGADLWVSVQKNGNNICAAMAKHLVSLDTLARGRQGLPSQPYNENETYRTLDGLVFRLYNHETPDMLALEFMVADGFSERRQQVLARIPVLLEAAGLESIVNLSKLRAIIPSPASLTL